MMKVLYVEDDTLMRNAIAHKIEHAGYEVSLAGDGIDALQVIYENLPDLILCDDVMPNMTGSELLAEIRNNHPQLAEIPFIILSGNSNRSQFFKGLENGADDYLIKPVDIGLMLAKINAMMRLKIRFEKIKNLEIADLHNEIKKQNNPEEQFSVLFDNLLERLEHEYEECQKLKKSAARMKVELMSEKELNMKLITKLNTIEGAINLSLSRLLGIRQKVKETKECLAAAKTDTQSLRNNLEEIGQSVEATIIPVASLANNQSR